MSPKNKNIDWKNNLCIHRPDESVWVKIEENLDFETHIATQLTELPLYKPNEKVWENISANLQKSKRIRNWYKITSTAAAITIIMVISSVFLKMNSEKVQNSSHYSYTSLSESEMEEKAINDIRSYCSLNSSACVDGNFKELMQLYDELKIEQTELKKAMNQLGDSPEMIQAMIKIENLKSEAIQDMIQLIQS